MELDESRDIEMKFWFLTRGLIETSCRLLAINQTLTGPAFQTFMYEKYISLREPVLYKA